MTSIDKIKLVEEAIICSVVSLILYLGSVYSGLVMLGIDISYILKRFIL